MTPIAPVATDELSAVQQLNMQPLANVDSVDFGQMLASKSQLIDGALVSANDAVQQFAIGQDLPPHQVMLSLEKARLQFQFALQIRNQLLQGYQQLTNAQL